MQSIVKEFSTEEEVKESREFKKISKKAMLGIPETYFQKRTKKELKKALENLIGREIELPELIKFIAPWIHTLQILGIIDEGSIAEEKDLFLNSILRSIDNLRKDILSWERNSVSLGLFTLLTGGALDIESFLYNLSELKSIVSFCINEIDFESGSGYCRDKVIRYGIYSLFKVGKTIGLVHAKNKKSPLFTFVEIITQLERKEIGRLYSELNEDKNTLLFSDNLIFEYINSDLNVKFVSKSDP